MKDFSNQSFKYSGKKYIFQASLFTQNSGKREEELALDNAEISLFTYDNALNQMYISAELEYYDQYGVVDRLLEKPFVYCQVFFNELEQKFDGGVVVEKYHDTNKFGHIFLVQNIQILSREKSKIQYHFSLVSNNWFNCVSQLSYTNHDVGPQSVFDILKALIGQAQLNVDSKSFDSVQTPVKLRYITNGNDNLVTTSSFLLHKLYYYPQKDDALKFVVYNEYKDSFQLFNIKDQNTATGTYSVVVSFFKSNTENIIQQDPINLGTVVQCPRTGTLRNMFQHYFEDFNYNYNRFVDRTVKSDQVQAYANEHFPSDVYANKFTKFFGTTLKFKRSGTYWNNDYQMYNDTYASIRDDNSLVISTSGEITRKPGSFIAVNVDRSLKYCESEDPSKLEELKKKYRTFEGLWATSKIMHFISPKDGYYRQNLVMMRNFVMKDS